MDNPWVHSAQPAATPKIRPRTRTSNPIVKTSLQKPWSERQADLGFVASGAVSNVVSNAPEPRGLVNDRLEGPYVEDGVGGVVSSIDA